MFSQRTIYLLKTTHSLARNPTFKREPLISLTAYGSTHDDDMTRRGKENDNWEGSII